MRPARKLAPDTDIVAHLRSLDPDARRNALELLDAEQRDAIDREWAAWAHEGQLPPPSAADGAAWSTWVIKAGRGFGKTLAGAQWVTGLVAGGAPLRLALVGATLEDARRVMVEGKSGLLEVADAWVTEWHPSLNRLRFRTGAEAALFSGATPHLLRGPEHHYAWCDELAKWEKPRETWDMLQLGLRLGSHPRVLVTTTPRPGPVLREIMADPDTVVTGGPTSANPHLPAAFRSRVQRLYAGTRLGRQELDGELLPDAAGALWTVELIERCRVLNPPYALHGEGDQPKAGGGETATHPSKNPVRPEPVEGPFFFLRDGPQEKDRPSTSSGRTEDESARPIFTRTLIAVDPPSGDGTCGIVACARDARGIAHVLADHSVCQRSPEGWAAAVAAAAQAHETTEIVAEANQGGKMVKAVLTAADPRLRVRLVTAHTGKTTRAEPVAHHFEAGRVRLHGRMPDLEAQLLGMIAGGGYEGPGASPDRADAMVWGVAEVMRERGEVRVRGM